MMNEPEGQVVQEKKVIFRAYQLIWYLLGVFETILLFRFAFKLLGANPGSPFVRFIYSISSALIYPFRTIFPQTNVEGSVFEWTSLVAIVVYFVVAYGLVHLFQIIKPVSKKEVERTLDNT